MRGSDILYGTTVQLRHQHTGKYLALTRERAATDPKLIKVRAASAVAVLAVAIGASAVGAIRASAIGVGVGCCCWCVGCVVGALVVHQLIASMLCRFT